MVLPAEGLPSSGCADAAARRHVHRLALGDGQAQQLAVGLANLVGLVQADLLEVDLVLDLEIALRRARPDGAGRGRERLQEALEQFAVEHDRRHVGLAEARNLFEALAEPAAFLFNHLEVDLWVRSGGHVSPSYWDKRDGVGNRHRRTPRSIHDRESRRGPQGTVRRFG